MEVECKVRTPQRDPNDNLDADRHLERLCHDWFKPVCARIWPESYVFARRVMNTTTLFTVAFLCALVAPARAQVAVAVVEDVKGTPAGVEFMDYVAPGKVIKLGPKDTIILGYLKSCWHETITGGTVQIGMEQSEVTAGTVARTKIPCDTAYRQLDEHLEGASGATIFRSTRPAVKWRTSEKLVLYGSSPIVEMKGGGLLTIERLDAPGERFSITADQNSLVRGKYYDFAKEHRSLKPGALYSASLNGRKQLFTIDQHAEPGSAPIISRLLWFH
jgi:hypothetical protein